MAKMWATENRNLDLGIAHKPPQIFLRLRSLRQLLG